MAASGNIARLALKNSASADAHRILIQAFNATGRLNEAIAEHLALLALLPYDEPNSYADSGSACDSVCLLALGISANSPNDHRCQPRSFGIVNVQLRILGNRNRT